MKNTLHKQYNNPEHARQCHKRWSLHLNRDMTSPLYEDDWYQSQCGGYAYYIRLEGSFHMDWGVCSNPDSPLDRSVRFEHDGCAAYVEAQEGW